MIIPVVLALLLGRYALTRDDDGAWLSVAALDEDARRLASLASAALSPAVLVGVAVAAAAIGALALAAVRAINAAYDALVGSNTVDLDAFLKQPRGAPLADKVKLLFGHRVGMGGAPRGEEPVPLAETASTFMQGLRVTVRQGAPNSGPLALTTAKPTRSSKPIVVGTIRMGFGHHRIAYAACSWALSAGNGAGAGMTYFHDLLGIESKEADLIKGQDKLYSKGSRLASELGGPIESMWGAITMSGGPFSLRGVYQVAETVKSLLLELPRDTPIVATHSLVALAAVAAGFENVINLVIDNHAQWFVVAPGALNLVQGPTNLANLLKMGVPAEQLKLVGHWIPKDLVENIPADCAARIERAARGAPLRLLVPVGGAGAQRTFVTALVAALAPRVRSGDVTLCLNAGDHAHMRAAFADVLTAHGLDHDIVETMEGVHAFCDACRAGRAPSAPVTLFAFHEYFPAVAATDVLSRVSDVLAVKPSELAFYPVPKLMIRRVGDHEQYAALRASELGDGTQEAREVADAVKYISVFKDIPGSPLLVSMNEKIMANAKIGIYNGCKNAIEIARSMK